MRRPSGAGAVLVVAVVIAVPIGAAVGIVLRERPVAVAEDAAAAPVVLPAPSVVVDGRRSTALTLTWADGPPVASPGGEGTITAIEVRPGDTLATGTLVARVDDRPVVALVGAAPLYRDLAVGDRGADVQAVRHLLVALTVLDPARADGDIVDAAVLAAASRAGLTTTQVPDGPETPPRSVIDRTSIAWVGPEPVTLGSVAVSLGSPWPSVGEAIGAGPTRLVAASAVAEGDAAPGFPPGSLEAAVGDAVVALDPDGSVVGEALVDLDAAVDGRPEQVDVEIRLVEPRTARAVPASAIVEGGCVFVRADAGWASREVSVIDTDLGRALVEGGDLPDEVLANPQQVLTEPACDS